MLTFEELLSRAGDQTLQGLVGRRIVRLLSRIDPALSQPERLREIITQLHSPAELLLDEDTRTELLMLLPRPAADNLAQVLGLEGDPYAAFQSLQIRRNSRRSDDLLDFFSVEELADSDEDDKPTLSQVPASYGLFPHQRLASRRVVLALTKEPHRVVLHMPTGSGKTRTAMSVICDLLNSGEPTLAVWLANSEELCEQAVEEFIRAWSSRGNREVQVHRWWGAHELGEAIPRDGLIVAGLAKAHASVRRSVREIGQLAGSVGLVVIDEAHQAIAPTYQLVLDFLSHAGSPTPLLGLTATPGRTWNDIDEDRKLADFFYGHKVLLEIPGYPSPVEYLVSAGYLAQVDFQPLHHQAGIELTSRDVEHLASGLDVPARIVQQLAEDEQRNLLIVNRTEQMVRKHDRLLIFAATVEHAVVLATVLRSRGYWANAVTGKTPSGARARLIREYREDSPEPRILVNYGVLTTGFDAPRTSGAIIARPTTSLVLYSQMVGRATRGPLAGGSEHAEVATVVDTGLPGFTSLVDAFHNWEDVWS